MGMRRRLLVLALIPAMLPIALTAPKASGATCVAAQKIDLWNKGSAVLRGANVYQGRNVGEGTDVPFGDGAFTQQDFTDLKAAGANYVHISHAGIFTEDAPYAPDHCRHAFAGQAVEPRLWPVRLASDLDHRLRGRR